MPPFRLLPDSHELPVSSFLLQKLLMSPSLRHKAGTFLISLENTSSFARDPTMDRDSMTASAACAAVTTPSAQAEAPPAVHLTE